VKHHKTQALCCNYKLKWKVLLSAEQTIRKIVSSGPYLLEPFSIRLENKTNIYIIGGSNCDIIIAH